MYVFIYIVIIMKNPVEYLKEDCLTHGFGRKAWWARQLKVPPLTISHWLAKRQKPNGIHTQNILLTLEEETAKETSETWVNHLWKIYYSSQHLLFPPEVDLSSKEGPSDRKQVVGSSIVIEKDMFILLAVNILHAPSVDTRTLALLSNGVETYQAAFSKVFRFNERLVNRLGWLLEISNQLAPFKPFSTRIDPMLPFAEKMLNSKDGMRYLANHQTRIGKKWHIYDCNLEPLKRTLSWRLDMNSSLAS